MQRKVVTVKGLQIRGNQPVCTSCSKKPPRTCHKWEEKQQGCFFSFPLLNISAASSHIPHLAPGDSGTSGLSHLWDGQKGAERSPCGHWKPLNMLLTVGFFMTIGAFVFLMFTDITLCTKSPGNCFQNNCTRQISSIANLFCSSGRSNAVLLGDNWKHLMLTSRKRRKNSKYWS